MMRNIITVFTVRDATAPANSDYGLRDSAVADLDGNMLFFGLETPKA
jgi:hypothetical protein